MEKTKTAKSSMAQDIAKGDIKVILKKLGGRFLIKLIPVAGPILASNTWPFWKIVKEIDGGATGPIGMFILVIGFIFDLISFIPILGPIINLIVVIGLLFAFKNALGAKEEDQEPEDKSTPAKLTGIGKATDRQPQYSSKA